MTLSLPHRTALLVFVVALCCPAFCAEPVASPAPADVVPTSSPAPSGTPTLPVPDIDNPYFRVLRNATAPAEANAHIGARVIVALKETVLHDSSGDRKLDRGQVAVFDPGQLYTVSGDYFEVSLKADHPPLHEPPVWIEPKKNTVIHDAPTFRIFEEKLEPLDTREVHSHAQRVVIRLNNVQLIDPRFHEKGGKGGFQVPDTAKYAEPIVHAVKNLGPGPLFNIVIEYKLPPHAAAPTS
jgi:hypothetical protein